jgi:hypothetical protein
LRVSDLFFSVGFIPQELEVSVLLAAVVQDFFSSGSVSVNIDCHHSKRVLLSPDLEYLALGAGQPVLQAYLHLSLQLLFLPLFFLDFADCIGQLLSVH